MKSLLNLEIKNIFLVIFFGTIFFVGVNSFKDYGVSSDEPNSRLKGLVTANYLGQKFFPKITDNYKKNFSIDTNKVYKISDLHEESKIKYYGVVFELPAFLLERIFKVNEKHKQYQLKHFLTFLVFFVSLISFYKLLNLRFQNWVIGILGVTIIVLSPRIFANSFYNNKDLIFLSFFVFSVHASLIFINKPNLKTLIFSSLFCALAIDVRIIGIITPMILLTTLSIKHFLYNKKIKSLFILITQYLIFLFLFIVIFWPYLWSDPINNFIEAYNTMSKYPHITHNLFLGKYELSTEIPNIYLLTWIIITTPPVYIFFFFIGLLFFLLSFIKNKNERFNPNFFSDFFCFSILFLVPFMIIYLGSTLYSGWRQLYFLYVLIIYFSIFGIYQTYLFINKNYKKYFIFFLY